MPNFKGVTDIQNWQWAIMMARKFALPHVPDEDKAEMSTLLDYAEMVSNGDRPHLILDSMWGDMALKICRYGMDGSIAYHATRACWSAGRDILSCNAPSLPVSVNVTRVINDTYESVLAILA